MKVVRKKNCHEEDLSMKKILERGEMLSENSRYAALLKGIAIFSPSSFGGKKKTPVPYTERIYGDFPTPSRGLQKMY